MFILSHKSALEYLKVQRCKGNKAISVQKVTNLDSMHSLLLKDKPFNSLTKPVNLMVFRTRKRSLKKSIRFHSVVDLEKYKIFENYDANFCIPIAPMIICQAASWMSFEKLFLLVLEFCGTYCVDNLFSLSTYQISAKTTISEIISFLDWKKNTNIRIAGTKKLKSVIKYVQNGSASPMESIIFAFLVLPKKFGGFGLKECFLNFEIPLSKEGRCLTGKSKVYGDICIPRANIVIEYDSKEFHLQNENSAADKIRRDGLVLDGWNVYTFTHAEVKTFKIFNTKIARILKKSDLCENRLYKDNFQRQVELHKKLITF